MVHNYHHQSRVRYRIQRPSWENYDHVNIKSWWGLHSDCSLPDCVFTQNESISFWNCRVCWRWEFAKMPCWHGTEGLKAEINSTYGRHRRLWLTYPCLESRDFMPVTLKIFLASVDEFQRQWNCSSLCGDVDPPQPLSTYLTSPEKLAMLFRLAESRACAPRSDERTALPYLIARRLEMIRSKIRNLASASLVHWIA